MNNNTNNINSNIIEVTINNEKTKVKSNITILDACRQNGIHIPTFCKHPDLKAIGACRICVVEIEGARTLVASCSTPIAEGMIIKTHSKRVLNARRTILELLIANHDRDCLKCKMNTNCKLQKYSSDYIVDGFRFNGEKRHNNIDDSSYSIVRNPDKCILCGKCLEVCQDIQKVYAIDYKYRGFKTIIGPAFDTKISASSCINCGQCVLNCPTGALTEKFSFNSVIDVLDSNKHVIVQTAPSVQACLGEEFGMEPGNLVTGKMISALRKIGFNGVFSTEYTADLTIMEEANELIERIKNKGNLPMFTSCCPGWVKYAEQFHHNILPNLSTCKSPQQMFGAIAKTYYAKKKGIDPKDIILVGVMPCTAKKFENQRPEMRRDVDFAMTTRELAKLIKEYDIDFKNLRDDKFDDLIGSGSGGGAIFGHTGGVTEAALRTAYKTFTNKKLDKLEFEQLSGSESIKEATIDLDGTKLNICVVNSTGNIEKIIKDVENKTSKYHFIEVMACPGGCIAGGGQPIPTTKEIVKKRTQALRTKDKSQKIRRCHENPQIKKLYKEFLEKPGSKIAHDLLHTHYVKREYK
jgi:NADP-reducing hydrogenase subunit HndD